MGLVGLALSGCGPSPPIPYRQLQIQHTEEAEGYDVYLYASIGKGWTPEEIEALLKWFDEVKYPQVNKMKVVLWTNPQGALMMNTGDMAGSLTVDREAGIYELTIGVR